eukprot:6199860-Pleurochrysis_carterae.AAC.2
MVKPASQRASECSHSPTISLSSGLMVQGGGSGGTGWAYIGSQRVGATARAGAGGASSPPTQSACHESRRKRAFSGASRKQG